MNELYFKTTQAWRDWLSAHHDLEDHVWLIFYKKETGEPSIEYESAVEEALCFGWIDSIIKKIDDSKYARKFTPRKENSKWSETNKMRVGRLIKSGRMTEIGLLKVEAAKQSGQWDKLYKPDISENIPKEFECALNQNVGAREYFETLAPSYRRQFIGWISVAKRPETREKRIQESISLLEKRRKLGMK